MNDIMRMTIIQRRHDLLEKPPRLVLWHFPSLYDVIKQFSTQIFNHHDDIARTRNDIVPNPHLTIS